MNKLDVELSHWNRCVCGRFPRWHEPEHAWQKLEAWAAPLGYLADTETPDLRFQQPEPVAGQPELRLRILDRGRR
ncbi:MAG: hypothetical protein R2856_24405 [Caldilineaceae bacterium]